MQSNLWLGHAPEESHPDLRLPQELLQPGYQGPLEPGLLAQVQHPQRYIVHLAGGMSESLTTALTSARKYATVTAVVMVTVTVSDHEPRLSVGEGLVFGINL